MNRLTLEKNLSKCCWVNRSFSNGIKIDLKRANSFKDILFENVDGLQISIGLEGTKLLHI